MYICVHLYSTYVSSVVSRKLLSVLLTVDTLFEVVKLCRYNQSSLIPKFSVSSSIVLMNEFIEDEFYSRRANNIYFIAKSGMRPAVGAYAYYNRSLC